MLLLALAARAADEPKAAERGPRFVVHGRDCAVRSSPDGKSDIRILIDPEENPDVPAYLGLGRFEPGAEIGEHDHPGSAELLYIVSGSGRMTVEGVTLKVVAGDAIRIPPGARHSFRNSGQVPLEAVQLYLPPGPEARFKLWPPRDPATASSAR
jgi:quercetin dioxygenase-like cupin family protein